MRQQKGIQRERERESKTHNNIDDFSYGKQLFGFHVLYPLRLSENY
jgi:hypothetical protein